MLICAVLVYEVHQIYGSRGHSVTMKKKQAKKHPAKMTSDELAEHVFHPKVLKAAREHIERHNLPKQPRSSK
jgi:hypothetical protein